ncbi:hypothetical protein CP97_14826 [Aurantiacibacter atlanticus]|uniref:Uncharacterized protein n=1 Tax=Aurantiacibacter atlanticus TaxID=1648404 RepID=A0A161IA50_9SPHN|nr:hypothetical protein CP97_14826 [Aurantiacibacter atlanticus]
MAMLSGIARMDFAAFDQTSVSGEGSARFRVDGVSGKRVIPLVTP